MGNQAGIIIRNVKNELFHSAKRLILNEVKGIECLLTLPGFCINHKAINKNKHFSVKNLWVSKIIRNFAAQSR